MRLTSGTVVAVAIVVLGTVVATTRAVAGSPAGMHDMSATVVADRAAVRHSSSLGAPPMPEATNLALIPPTNAVTFNTCTANRVFDDRGGLLGLAGAAHCVHSSGNTMRDGETFGTGAVLDLPRTAISIDPTGDIFYVGLDGHRAFDVRGQLALNHRRIGRATAAQPAIMFMSGYPAHNNAAGEITTIPLSYAGSIVWPDDPRPAIATFGNWTASGRSCSPRASGSGLYALDPERGYRIIGVLSGRAEFDNVQTMPYTEEYGHELRAYFEQQLERSITADYLCAFTPAGH